MKILKWIGMFFLLWFLGTVVALFVEKGLGILGGTLGEYGGGFLILIIIIVGLFRYGKRKSN